MSIRIICPTRQRVSRCAKMLESFFATRSSTSTQMFCYVDEADPQRADYRRLFDSLGVSYEFGPKRTMVEAVNYGCSKFDDDYYGVLNDDHLCHTPGWDCILAAAIKRNGGTGMAYGKPENREALPQIILISCNCVRALGWYLPPWTIHQYGDNVQKDLYFGAGLAFPAEEVFIEHLHPDFGKAEMDSTYQIMRDAHDHDRAAYDHWKGNGGFLMDLAKLVRLKNALTPAPA